LLYLESRIESQILITHHWTFQYERHCHTPSSTAVGTREAALQAEDDRIRRSREITKLVDGGTCVEWTNLTNPPTVSGARGSVARGDDTWWSTKCGLLRSWVSRVGERDRYGKPRRRHRRLRVAGWNHGRARGGQPQDKVRTLRSTDDSALKFGDAILDRWTTGSAPCCAKLGSSLHPREGVACASAGGRLEIVKGLLVCWVFIPRRDYPEFFDPNSLRGTDPADFMLDRKSEQENLKKKKKSLPSFILLQTGEPFWRY